MRCLKVSHCNLLGETPGVKIIIFHYRPFLPHQTLCCGWDCVMFYESGGGALYRLLMEGDIAPQPLGSLVALRIKRAHSSFLMVSGLWLSEVCLYIIGHSTPF